MGSTEQLPTLLTDVVTVPMVGDGNPATALAIFNHLADQPGSGDVVLIQQDNPAVRKARQFHQIMTRDPDISAEYTRDSANRLNLKSRVFSHIMRLLLRREIASMEHAIKQNPYALIDSAKTLHVVQAHVLITMKSEELTKLGVEKIIVYSPDAYAKGEVSQLFASFPNLEVHMWHEQGADELRRQFRIEASRPMNTGKIDPEAVDSSVKVVEPFLLCGLTTREELTAHEGVPVVVKSSGSGMPKVWLERLFSVLDFRLNPDEYAFHVPPELGDGIGQPEKYRAGNSVDRYVEFVKDLGYDTRTVIAYPSEVVQIIYEMYQWGVTPTLLLLPPRGEHELMNIQAAIDSGIDCRIIHFPESDGLRIAREFDIPAVRLHQVADHFQTPK